MPLFVIEQNEDQAWTSKTVNDGNVSDVFTQLVITAGQKVCGLVTHTVG